jgi:hypothetical protein
MCAEADHVGWPQTNEGNVMRKIIMTVAAMAMLAVPTVAMASGGPTTGPESGPGCFGNWRAGSVQALQAGTIPGYESYDNAGKLLSERAQGDLGMQAWVGIDKSYC